MWKGVRTYVDGVVEDRILHELTQINPNLEQRQRKRLRLMAKKASQLATCGNTQQALIQLRSCLLLSMAGVQDPETLASVQSLVSVLPYAQFEEPTPQREETLSVPEIDEVLKNIGVTCGQVQRLSVERRRALMQTLLFRLKSPPIMCPISWEELSDAKTGKLFPDIVAIFEEDHQDPSLSKQNNDDSESIVLLVEHSQEITESDTEESYLASCETGSFRFATSVVDSALNSSVSAIKAAVDGAKRLSHNVLSSSSMEEQENGNSSTEEALATSTSDVSRQSNKLPDSVFVNRRVSVQLYEKSDAVRPCRYVITPAQGSSIQIAKANENMRKERVLIRCHLFKGSAIKEWFNLGHASNPVTRATVLVDDWCRLTDEPKNTDNYDESDGIENMNDNEETIERKTIE